MKVSIVKGATSVLLRIFIQDSSSTTGAGLTGLVFNTAGLTCYRMRDDDGNAGATAISLATATLGTWATGGFKEKDATNAPGWYEFGVTNAAIATGSRTVGIHLKGATNMAPLPIEIELTGWDNQDAVRGGMTALPNAAAETAGGLYTRGTGAGQIAQDANGNVRVNVDTIKTNPVVNGGTITFPTTATLASTTNITAGTIATVTTVTNQLTAAAIATGIWQDATAGDFTAANSIGKSIMNGVALGTGLTVARVTLADTLTTYTGNTVQTADVAALITTVGAAGVGLTAVSMSATGNNAAADALLNRNMATGTDSSSDSVRTLRSALRQIRNKWLISGSTITYTKEDDTTASHTAALTGTAGADPITGADPAA